MRWFRMHTEARTDRKLDTLTDAEFRVWFNLLCYAAEQPERGVIECEDHELLALEVARGDAELLGHALSRLSRLRVVTYENGSIEFINWTERQYDKPSDHPEQTRARKQKSRANKPDSDNHATDGVTPRDVTPRTEQSRSDTENNLLGSPKAEPTEKMASRLPENWQPTEAMIEYAIGEGFTRESAMREADRFRDYWRGRAGKDGRKLDWLATWRNWIRKAADQRAAQASRRSAGNPSRELRLVV